MRISLKTPCNWDGIDEIVIDRYPYVVGRDYCNDCELKFAFVSRQHCQFTLQNETVLIQDLESYNGTFVNGRRISQPTPLHDGDELSLGPLCFRVSLLGQSPETLMDTGGQVTRSIPNVKSSEVPLGAEEVRPQEAKS
jgi:pSer/pThr/pTyr-binding forkhead associated (FHA) protein